MKKIKDAVQALAPVLEEGSMVFIKEGNRYHRFRKEGEAITHTETHTPATA